jgi:hypothetical protein
MIDLQASTRREAKVTAVGCGGSSDPALGHREQQVAPDRAAVELPALASVALEERDEKLKG